MRRRDRSLVRSSWARHIRRNQSAGTLAVRAALGCPRRQNPPPQARARMIRDLHSHAARLQAMLLRAAASLPAETWARDVPRVLLDAWASLVRWHECGERVWRISAAAADETGDMLLPADLPLATARVRAEAVCYQLPARETWIVLARHAPAPCEVIVRGDLRWAYRQPVLTYCTQIDDSLASGIYNLDDCPTAGSLPLTIAPGTSLGLRGVRPLGEAEVSEEEARISLALIHHYMP